LYYIPPCCITCWCCPVLNDSTKRSQKSCGGKKTTQNTLDKDVNWSFSYHMSNFMTIMCTHFEVHCSSNTPNYVGFFFASILIGWSLFIWWCRCERIMKQNFVKNNWYIVRLCPSFKRLCKFYWKLRSYFLHPPTKDFDLLPHKWWEFIRIGGCTFAPIACLILVQMCFTSSCKQNWSSYSFVYNKVQTSWCWIRSNVNHVFFTRLTWCQPQIIV
jgi:hypothetical protein